MKYIELFGKDIQQDAEEIRQAVDADAKIVFIYSPDRQDKFLHDYIDNLYENGVDSSYLYKFKVCYEKTDLQISCAPKSEKELKKISSISGLLRELDCETPCRIIVENDDPAQLAFIMQQLIYIDYPLSTVDILLRKEEKDAAKSKRFMQRLSELQNNCKAAITDLHILHSDIEGEIDNKTPQRLKDVEEALGCCTEIGKLISKAQDVELKLAVAASKKAGKSVIVNCFLGEQIAPTSVELATPNNCIYKKSQDEKYHLQIGSDGQIQDFADNKAIAATINKCFREAQNDTEHRFIIPDMTIGYPSGNDNFSTYTIYDTAGPDAAGTDHKAAADKALRECDVAVFAIDYAKYLTDSENDYLKKVKETFINKFHSLIFALNKIDVRYNDAGTAKSLVKSVDFIRKRLADIDDAYRDCIIFPTCSLEYFYAVATEKAGVSELQQELTLDDETDELRKVTRAHKDVEALGWLYSHAERLSSYHGITKISYAVFQKDSGMPALMDHVSYVAKSKARDEIINSVSFEIDKHTKKIKGIIDYIANLEAFISANDDKIQRIQGIIDQFDQDVQKILSEKFSEQELLDLPKSALLRKFKGNYNNIIASQKEGIESAINPKTLDQKLYQTIIAMIWYKLKSAEVLDGHEIEALFGPEELKTLAEQLAHNEAKKAAQDTSDQMRKLREEVKHLAEKRFKELSRASESCRSELEKQNVQVALPELPEFDFATEMTSPEEFIDKIGPISFNLFDRLSGMFKRKWWGNIGTFINANFNIFSSKTSKDYKRKFKGSLEEFSQVLPDFERDFKTYVYDHPIFGELSKSINEHVCDGYMNRCIEELNRAFTNLNDSCSGNVKRFKQAIDDRQKYKDDIAGYEAYKATIQTIDEYTDAFMASWNGIVGDLSEAENDAAAGNAQAEA